METIEEILNEKDELLNGFYDEIENIKIDISNVDYDQNASLVAALDFVESQLDAISTRISKIQKKNNDLLNVI